MRTFFWGQSECDIPLISLQSDTCYGIVITCIHWLFVLFQIKWLIDNYETAEGVSLPRSTLYNHYLRHCAAKKIDAVNAASFGKLIRSVFIGLKTRRLGTRFVHVHVCVYV